MAIENTVGQVRSVQGDVQLISASGEKVLLAQGDVISLNDVIISPDGGALQVQVSASELSGFVSVGSSEMVKMDAALLANNAYLLAQSSVETPLTIGTPTDSQVMLYLTGAASPDDGIIIATPYANYADVDDIFVWRDSDAQSTVDSNETITFQLADITGMDQVDQFIPEFTQSTGTLKLGDLITGSATSALEAASYLHVTATSEGVSGLYIDRKGNITDHERAALNESSEIFGNSTSVESAADQIQELMDMGFIEL